MNASCDETRATKLVRRDSSRAREASNRAWTSLRRQEQRIPVALLSAGPMNTLLGDASQPSYYRRPSESRTGWLADVREATASQRRHAGSTRRTGMMKGHDEMDHRVGRRRGQPTGLYKNTNRPARRYGELCSTRRVQKSRRVAIFRLATFFRSLPPREPATPRVRLSPIAARAGRTCNEWFHRRDFTDFPCVKGVGEVNRRAWRCDR